MNIDDLVQEIDTIDGFKTLRILKEDKRVFLGSKYNYKREIENLYERLGEVKDDSIIIIFGHDSGSYLEGLDKKIGMFSKIIVFEPNQEVYLKYKKKYIDSEKIILYELNERLIGNQLKQIINQRNFLNIQYSFFGNYNTVYLPEYYQFIKAIKQAYANSYSNVCTIISYKDFIWRSIYNNIKLVNESIFFDDIQGFNKKTPALIISAGPSLDKNIDVLKRNKEKLKEFFIVANSRTVKPLVENGIYPDIICVIDGSDYMYDMMEEYLDLQIPLLYIEQTNNKLLKKYLGPKIIASSGILESMPQFRNEKIQAVYSGGSVAHTSVDVAVRLNCNPIIFCGQDLAYTFNKYHSNNTTNEFDKKNKSEKKKIITKDVFGEEIYTDEIFSIFKDNLEDYISIAKQVEFINSSYGAKINGADFRELEDIFQNKKFGEKEKLIYSKREKKYDVESVEIDINAFIKEYIPKIECAIKKCNENKLYVDSEKISENLKYVMKVNQEFIDFEYIKFLDLYFEQFIFDTANTFAFKVDEEKEIIKYSKKLSVSFEEYFLKLKNMLISIRNIIKEEEKYE